MTQKVFEGETTATSVDLTSVDNHQFVVCVGGSGIPGTSVQVHIKPPRGIQFYLTEIFTSEDVKTITVPKGSTIRFTTVGTSTGVNVEIHPLV